MKPKKITGIIVSLIFGCAQLLAWGPKGHAVVADVAASHLTPVTGRNVALLLGQENMASVSYWADDVRKDRAETYAWHFVDIPKDASSFSHERDCYRPQDRGPLAHTDHANCVVDRIEMFRKTLADANASRKERVEALKFLIHFVADIHQPLHDIDEARGGNDIKVAIFGSDQCGNYPCNLHGAWDYALIEHAGYSEDEYVRHLDSLIKNQHLEVKAGGRAEDWANESHAAARQILDEHPSSIDQAYWNGNIGRVDQQLALAGLRLAMLLNDTLGKIPTQQLKRDLQNHDAI
jgi:hypothetical protein